MIQVTGIMLLCAGFVLFLLRITIATSSRDAWSSGHIIAMLVVGFVLVASFGCWENSGAWEKSGACHQFVVWRLLKNRTVIGAWLLGATYQIAYHCWNSYFTSYLRWSAIRLSHLQAISQAFSTSYLESYSSSWVF
jgi:hypothetical protein